MDSWWSIFGQFADTIRLVWGTINNKPQVICDIKGVFEGEWELDYLPESLGGNEGVRITQPVTLLLANNGSLDTTIKDVYINVRYARTKFARLKPSYMNKTKIQGIRIEPRGIWGPETVIFEGSLWDIIEPPKDLQSELVIEPVAQRPVRRQIKLFL